MTLQDALFNWLQMKIVSEARPDDGAAKETLDFFHVILEEDHRLSGFGVHLDETKYTISFVQDGTSKKQMFERESAEKLMEDINSNPKYNNA